MNRRPAARFARAATARLMVLLAIALGLPQGVAVLCAGPDGHLAVELAAGPPASRPQSPTPADDGCGCAEECGPCQDVHVGSGDTVFRPAAAPQPEATPTDACASVPEGTVPEPPHPGPRPVDRGLLCAAPIPLLRSVVLLI